MSPLQLTNPCFGFLIFFSIMFNRILHYYVCFTHNYVFPSILRFARSNSIFLGLWFGMSKLDFLTFLQPVSKEFQDIYSKGIYIVFLFNHVILVNTAFQIPPDITFMKCPFAWKYINLCM